MKKSIFSLALIFVWLFTLGLSAPRYAFADPPQDVLLNYDLKTRTLTVTIQHPSTFTSLHYIKQIEIKKNNEPAEKKTYSSQPGKTAFEYTYRVEATANDILEVAVSCNIQGRKTAALKVQ